jgi:hypothetical protein
MFHRKMWCTIGQGMVSSILWLVLRVALAHGSVGNIVFSKREEHPQVLSLKLSGKVFIGTFTGFLCP